MSIEETIEAIVRRVVREELRALERVEPEPLALLCRRAVAEAVGVSERAVDRAVGAGRLRVVRIGRSVRFRREGVERWISGGGARTSLTPEQAADRVMRRARR